MKSNSTTKNNSIAGNWDPMETSIKNLNFQQPPVQINLNQHINNQQQSIVNNNQIKPNYNLNSWNSSSINSTMNNSFSINPTNITSPTMISATTTVPNSAWAISPSNPSKEQDLFGNLIGEKKNLLNMTKKSQNVNDKRSPLLQPTFSSMKTDKNSTSNSATLSQQDILDFLS